MYQIEDIKNTIIQGNVLIELQKIPNESIDTIITSPPYWNLRDYGEGTKTIWDGDKNCEHEWGIEIIKKMAGGAPVKNTSKFCQKCGAWYGQLGLEPSLDLYYAHLLQVTAELKRILKPSGILWWNHGDSYCGGQGHFDAKNPKAREDKLIPDWENYFHKCLYLQNWRLIIRMIDIQKWILRNTIIWHKTKHTPSPIKDRFTNAYEPIFMLAKSKKYYFDLDAVRIPWKQTSIDRFKYPLGILGDPITRRPSLSGKRVLLNPNKYKFTHYPQDHSIHLGENPKGKNPGDVWEIPYHPKGDETIHGQGLPPQPNQEGVFHPLGENPVDVWSISTQVFKGAHFATFPEKLIEPMILAGCPKNGIVLDPFMGSGTTAAVAKRLCRNWIGIELNPKYIEMAQKRINNTIRQEELFDNL